MQPKGLSVPQRAILRDSAGVPKVLVVDPQARISDRQVVLGNAQGDRWVVSEGLAPGEQVVIEGLQHVKAGDQVQVEASQGTAPGAPPIAQHNSQ
ncbi:Multidrug export protein AcrE precursor [compost metagenome]